MSDEFLDAIQKPILFAVGVSILIFGCWATGKTHDNWRTHDEGVNQLRREKSVTNPYTPVRKEGG